MVYYTERNGMRKPIERTYDISTDKYALLLDCCEKYYNNLAWKFPEQCPDGRGCCGLDEEKFNRSLKFDIPTLYRDVYGKIAAPATHTDYFADEETTDKYDQFALLDALRKIGNNFRIRHHERDKIDISDPRHYDYFFNRCLSLIALAIQYLQ